MMHHLIDEIFCHMSKIKLQNMSWSFQLSNLINSGFKLDRSQSFSILCLNKSQSQTDSATFNLMIWFGILKTVKSEFPWQESKYLLFETALNAVSQLTFTFCAQWLLISSLNNAGQGYFICLCQAILFENGWIGNQ